MQKKISIKKVEIIGTIFGIILGTMLHFTYDWSGLAFIGLFSAVNESVWEHTKLVFFPIVFYYFVERLYVKETNVLLLAKVKEATFVVLFIITFFYFYTGAFGFESLFIDIMSFVVAVLIGKYISYKTIASREASKIPQTILYAVIISLLGFFIIATFYPPRIPLFKDTNTNTYGIN